MCNFTKEIEAKFERGNEFVVNGITYIIRNFAKYYKVRENNKWVQYDIALYLYTKEDIEHLRNDDGVPTNLFVHYFNL